MGTGTTRCSVRETRPAGCSAKPGLGLFFKRVALHCSKSQGFRLPASLDSRRSPVNRPGHFRLVQSGRTTHGQRPAGTAGGGVGGRVRVTDRPCVRAPIGSARPRTEGLPWALPLAIRRDKHIDEEDSVINDLPAVRGVDRAIAALLRPAIEAQGARAQVEQADPHRGRLALPSTRPTEKRGGLPQCRR